MSAEPSPWRRACLAAAAFAVDPLGMGVWLRAAPGPARDAWLDLCRAGFAPDAPWRRAPAHIADDGLLGGLDLAATLRAGRPVAAAGLLAGADGGVVLLAMAERAPAATAARLAAALDTGFIDLQRDGLSLRLSAHVGVVALDEGLADERPPACLVERLAYGVDLDEVGLRDLEPTSFSPEDIARARAALREVEAAPEALEALVGVAARLGVGSLRGPLFALRAARALAALAGRLTIEDDDLSDAAALVLAPRATLSPAAPEEPAPEPEQPPPPPGDSAEGQELSTAELQDIVLAAARAAIPPDLLAKFAAPPGSRRRGDDGKSGAATISKTRGRPLEPRPGQPRDGRVALLATLRAAAPWQALRARETGSTAKLQVRTQDIRIVRYRQRRGATAVFVVDASGSSALQRLGEVKGAIESLLSDCYVRRDSVALIAFRSRGAELVLPPTRSTARARRALAGLPGGGGTPIASGLDAALTLALQIERRGQTPLLVLMTDGRANIARDGAPGRARAMADALEAGRRVRAAGISALAIDTSGPSRVTDAPTERLAEAMRAHYLRLPFANAERLSEAVRAAS